MKPLSLSINFLKYLALAVIFLFLMFPVYWMIVTSFKTNAESFRVIPTLWPEVLSIQGYIDLISEGRFMTFYRNNFYIASVVTIINCVISIFAGYSLSRFKFNWTKLLISTFIFAQMMPVISRLISLQVILRRIGLTDSHWGLILAISATQIPFAVSLMASFFDGIPREIEEAAFIDGSGRLYTLFRVLLPLVVPGLLAAGVYIFLMTWDDYLHAVALIRSPNLWTLSQGLALTYLGEVANWQQINSAATLGAMPMVFVFFFFQRYMINGLVSGAVKG